jgi:hypothetical protein
MSAIVDTGELIMQKRNVEWSKCIEELLKRHNLTLRGAEVYSDHAVTRSYISEWMHGKVPQYQAAVSFLEHFPREEAIECLKAAEYPVPDEWREEIPLSPTPEQLMYALRTTYDQLSDEQREYVEKFVKDKKAERRRNHGK